MLSTRARPGILADESPKVSDVLVELARGDGFAKRREVLESPVHACPRPEDRVLPFLQTEGDDIVEMRDAAPLVVNEAGGLVERGKNEPPHRQRGPWRDVVPDLKGLLRLGHLERGLLHQYRERCLHFRRKLRRLAGDRQLAREQMLSVLRRQSSAGIRGTEEGDRSGREKEQPGRIFHAQPPLPQSASYSRASQPFIPAVELSSGRRRSKSASQ